MCEPKKPFAPVNRTRFAMTKVGRRKGMLTYETVRNDFSCRGGIEALSIRYFMQLADCSRLCQHLAAA